MSYLEIEKVIGREIIDSRGNPTVEAEVWLADGTPLRSVLPCYLREALALLYYWVFKTSVTGPMHTMVGLLDMNKKFFYK